MVVFLRHIFSRVMLEYGTVTVQKGQHLRLVPLIQCVGNLYMTHTVSVASILGDFYALSTYASLDYMEYAGRSSLFQLCRRR
jgi:hypothetical protein